MKLIVRTFLTLALLVASNVAIAPQAASAEALPNGVQVLGYHTVRSGETLYCIGRAYGVQPWAIASQNGLGWSSVLIVGQVLAIPSVTWGNMPSGPVCERQFPHTPPPPPPVCSAWHVVRYGDTLSGIAWWYGVNLYTLAARNNIYNVNLIFVGTTLCIP